ncbi:conserved hypothetical protein [Ricinus communis]|uniref:DUF4378 domain-containing protein n=1 Tax=Ricinus communis TaxID=3988 RepID=B9S7Z8_RICCO|nr:conserved hypothetical protein [Ricinus communis]
MAASSSKQLREHLQEQQEPFILDIYLSERMVLNNHQRRLSRSNLKKRIFSTKKILKLILYKFIRPNLGRQDFNCHKAHRHGLASETTEQPQQIGASKRQIQIQKIIRNSTQDQLLSEATSSNTGCQDDEEEDDASTSSTALTKTVEEDSIFSSFLWDLLVKTLLEKQNQPGLMDVQKMTCLDFSELLKNKRALQQTKQLLFDCINEAIKIHDTKSRNKKYNREFMGLQEHGNVIYEQICSWANQNSAQKTKFDVSLVVEGWEEMKRLDRKIGTQIGDAIMDEMTQEVIGLFFQ